MPWAKRRSFRLSFRVSRTNGSSAAYRPTDETQPQQRIFPSTTRIPWTLFEYFGSGPHAIREGVIFERLAFVQQVDMGDEWLVLKREFDEGSGETLWIPFESYSFESIVKSKARFECAVSALLDADPYDIAAIFADGGNASRRQRQGRTTS